mgnify:FL=1
MLDYKVPRDKQESEIEIKRSRFLAFIKHTKGSEQAKAYIHELKTAYPDARHHCYAFISGSPSDSNRYGFSDDGEPSGTAGMPIFTHLKHSGLGEVTIVVVRYFGGTKLGTGGLARAYGEAAKQVLMNLPTSQHVTMEELNIELSFAQEAQIRKKIEDAGGTIVNAEYSQLVRLRISVPKTQDFKLPYSVQLLPKSTI